MEQKTYYMNETYHFDGGSEAKAFGPLPAGDYNFIVIGCDEPYKKESGNWVCRLLLAIQPGGEKVFDQVWSGQTRDGESRDGIGDFLLAVNRAPKKGSAVDWPKVVGARGKCRLKVELAQQGTLAGKEVNKVHYYHKPKEVGPTAPKTYSKEEAESAQGQAVKNAGGDDEPIEIPF